jgi:arylsulfatase A-like enzyme
VLVVLDDMRVDDLPYMPATRRLVTRHGVRFTDAFSVSPTCCPSRASMLTGNYPHNTGVWDNVPPHGGWGSFRDDEHHTIATRLRRSGYRTAMIGKYLAGYAERAPRHVPPGWNRWAVPVKGEFRYHGRAVYNINGQLRSRTGWQDDLRTAMATSLLSHTRKPAFVWLSYLAPHRTPDGSGLVDPIPARRDRHAYDGTPRPHNPAVNEARVKDKPPVLRSHRLSRNALRRIRRSTELRRESLLTADRGIRRIVRTLKREHEWRSSYLIITSDNGYFAGEHRHPRNKSLHYEPSSQVPLVVHGPGLGRGRTSHRLVGLHDLAPTITRWGQSPRRRVDGQLLFSSTSRPGILIENANPTFKWRRYSAVRTPRWKYVRYVGGQRELYHLSEDRWENRNLAGDPAYKAQQHRLGHLLTRLKRA